MPVSRATPQTVSFISLICSISKTPGWVAILFVGAALFRSSITVIVQIDLERVFVNRHPIGQGWSSMCPASISKHPDRPAEVCKAS